MNVLVLTAGSRIPARALDWGLWFLSMWSPSKAAWAPSQHGGWVSSMSILRNQGRNIWYFCDLSSEVTQCHFCCTALVRAVIKPSPNSRGWDIDSTSWWRSWKVLEEHMGWEILLQPFLKNITFQVCSLATIHIPPTCEMHPSKTSQTFYAITGSGSISKPRILLSNQVQVQMRLLSYKALGIAPWYLPSGPEDLWTKEQTVSLPHPTYNGGTIDIDAPIQRGRKWEYKAITGP